MTRKSRLATLFLSLWIGCGLLSTAAAQTDAKAAGSDAAAPDGTRLVRNEQWLMIPPVGGGGRAPIHTDAIEAAIVAGAWTPPQAGDVVRLPDGTEKTWTAAAFGADGWLRDEALAGGYVCWTFESDAERVLLLDAVGHSLVYVNGTPRAGDVYSTGWVLLPVRVRAGANVFLFRVGRGELRAALVEAPADVCFSTRSTRPSGSEAGNASSNDPPPVRSPRDLTSPDLIRGETEPVWAALPLLNTTPEFRRDLAIIATYPDGRAARTSVPPIPPLGMLKAGFMLPAAAAGDGDAVPVELKLVADVEDGEQTLDTIGFDLAVRAPTDKHKRTFISEIDGSVQYFAVTPAHPGAGETADALFLSLHGASVEATNQANAYEHKTWGNIVAATNRRPFGFDWEDWGRLDAMEVLGQAEQLYHPDPHKVYLTGHSMGGHGTWQVGVNHSDRFAAIAPSASWPDFWMYAGAAEYDNATPIEQILLRSVSPSRTLTLIRNTLMYGVYILHGDADDNVPVDLARKMRTALAEFHADFAYYERPGAGHWWGAECVDWPPLFDFLKDHRRPDTAEVRHIEFHTANPGVNGSAHWIIVGAQTRQHEPSAVTIDLDAEKRLFAGTTTNVARLSIDLRELSGGASATANAAAKERKAALPAGTPVSVRLDDQLLENIPWPDAEPRLWLRRENEQWTVISRPDPYEKNPRRYGPFKHAFNHRFLFVYGTHGTDEMNQALYNKARFDAETFWYRGNGVIELVPDTEFDPSRERDRGVILYGNAENNSAWAALLGDSPVQVKNDGVRIGERMLAGADLACLFIRPRPGSETALVGVVGGTGPRALRATERLPIFLSGVGFPDCLVFGTDVLTAGDGGIRAAGFFGLDWKVETGDFAWRDPAAAK